MQMVATSKGYSGTELCMKDATSGQMAVDMKADTKTTKSTDMEPTLSQTEASTQATGLTTWRMVKDASPMPSQVMKDQASGRMAN